MKKLLLFILAILFYLLIIDINFFLWNMDGNRDLSSLNSSSYFTDDTAVMKTISGPNIMRDKQSTSEKSDEEYRIVVLGDSFTYGYGELINETYPAQLEIMLNQSDSNINIINFAGNGHNTIIEYLQLTDLVPKYNPDLVVIAYFINDPEILHPELLEACENIALENGLNYYPFKNIVNYISKRVFFFLSTNEDSFFYNLYADDSVEWTCTKKLLKYMANFSQETNQEIVMFVLPNFDSGYGNQLYVDIKDKIDSAMNSSGLEYYNLESDIGRNNGSFYNDVGHYNFEGNKLVAEYMFEILKEKIKP